MVDASSLRSAAAWLTLPDPELLAPPSLRPPPLAPFEGQGFLMPIPQSPTDPRPPGGLDERGCNIPNSPNLRKPQRAAGHP